MGIAEKNETSYPQVVVKKLVKASREKVFDAWTQAEIMKQWFVPKNWSAETSIDLRVGGSYSHDMISHGSGDGCSSSEKPASEIAKHYLHTGEYLEINRPKKLVFTWNSHATQDTRVTVDFSDIGDSTEVKITHELLSTEKLRDGHETGWKGHLDTLAGLFE